MNEQFLVTYRERGFTYTKALYTLREIAVLVHNGRFFGDNDYRVFAIPCDSMPKALRLTVDIKTHTAYLYDRYNQLYEYATY